MLLMAMFFIQCSLPASRAVAQEAHYRMADATQLWRLTDHAAALALDSSENRGYAQFGVEHRGGDYHRVQEGGMRNQLEFLTERYQRISQLLVGYGKYRFDMDRTKERAWCDVARPYHSNPYFAGSSIKGKYDTQQFDLTAAVGTIPLWGVTAGLRLDYSVADLSRLRDPRSRSELLDYKLTPSLSYSSGSSTLAMSGHYERRKEKVPSVNTVQQDPNLKYYLMKGMEDAIGMTGGYSGYSQEWVDHRFGAALSYGYNNGSMKSVSTASIERGSEDVLGQYKYQPGHFVSYAYGIESRNRLSGKNILHAIDLSLSYRQAYADEYRQQLLQERDPEKGYTSYHYETLITFKKRFQVKQLAAKLHYRINGTDGGDAMKNYAGVNVSYNDDQDKHLLPTSSQQYSHLDLTAEGGTSLLANRRLWIDAEAGYHISTKADLQLADATTDYAVNVLLADLPYYEADYWRANLAVTYQFPVKLKGMENMWFVKAYGKYLGTNNSLNTSTVGLAFGLFY